MAKKLLLWRTTIALGEYVDIPARTTLDPEPEAEKDCSLSDRLLSDVHPLHLSKKNITTPDSTTFGINDSNEESPHHITISNSQNPMSVRSSDTFSFESVKVSTVLDPNSGENSFEFSNSQATTSLNKTPENGRHESNVNIHLPKEQRMKKNENAKRFRESGRRRRFELELNYENLLERNQFLQQKYQVLLQEKAALVQSAVPSQQLQMIFYEPTKQND